MKKKKKITQDIHTHEENEEDHTRHPYTRRKRRRSHKTSIHTKKMKKITQDIHTHEEKYIIVNGLEDMNSSGIGVTEKFLGDIIHT